MIELYLLGGITSAVPLIVWYMRREFTAHINMCQKLKAETTEIVEKLKSLHNNAMQANADILKQLEKINTDVAVLKSARMLARQ